MASRWFSWPYDQLRWHLAERPSILAYEWSPTETHFSSLSFLISAILLYLSAVLLLLLRPLPPPPPPLLRLLSSLHNALLLSLSLAMALGCSLSFSASHSQSHSPVPTPLWRWLLCFPPGATPPRGPVFFWAYAFYLSKIYELLDTLLILVSRRPLSFLHVYHHAVVPVMCYLWLATSQSLFPIALVTNATVHVVMYSYYLSCSVGWRWPTRWKRAVTEVQIAQFAFSFAVSLGFLWFHFGDGGGCEGFKGWVFNAVFNVSLFVLFIDFHGKAYEARKKKRSRVKRG